MRHSRSGARRRPNMLPKNAGPSELRRPSATTLDELSQALLLHRPKKLDNFASSKLVPVRSEKKNDPVDLVGSHEEVPESWSAMEIACSSIQFGIDCTLGCALDM